MTFPTVVNITNRVSVSDEGNCVITLPAGIQEGDEVVIFEACRDGSGADPFGTGDLVGWTRFWSSQDNFSTNAASRAWSKIMKGTESGAVLTTPSNNNTGRCTAAFLLRGVDRYSHPHCGTGAGNNASANPDPPSRTAPWGSADNLWLIWAGGIGTPTFSGTPQNGDAVNYSGVTHLFANTTNQASAAYGWTQRAAATENPTALTRLSGAHTENTIAVRPAQPSRHAKVRHRCTSVQRNTSTGSPQDFTVHVEGGPNTRVVCIVTVNGLTGNALTVTLDPTGVNIPLTAASDGGSSFSTQSGHRFFTSVATKDLAPGGDYTLRIAGNTGVKSVWWFEIEDTPDESDTVLDVRLVTTGTVNSNVVDTTIDGEDRGLIIALVSGSWSCSAFFHTFNGDRPHGYGDSLTGSTTEHVMIGRAVAGSNALHLEHGSDSTGNTLSVSAISLGFVPPESGALMAGAL